MSDTEEEEKELGPVYLCCITVRNDGPPPHARLSITQHASVVAALAACPICPRYDRARGILEAWDRVWIPEWERRGNGDCWFLETSLDEISVDLECDSGERMDPSEEKEEVDPVTGSSTASS